MVEHAQHRQSRRLLIVMPTWVGDTIMATPTIRALRALYPEAHIAALVRSSVRPLLESNPWLDRLVTIRPKRRGMPADGRRTGPLTLARRLAAGKFDTAILLPNSFRTALFVRLAGIPRRVGYDRDGRGFLLTDRLLPLRSKGRFVPVSTVEYYLGLAAYLGAVNLSSKMELFTRPEDDARALAMLRRAGFNPEVGKPLVLINPGANYGEAKLWFADRFAAVADRLSREHGVTVAVTGAPKERPIIDKVIASAKEPLLNLPAHGLDLLLLKSVVKMSRLMVTNDTGPRHIAAAMGVPVVTIFGPTDPAWTDIGFSLERQARERVDCGPCQKKQCPLRGTPDELVCMKRVEASAVFDLASKLLRVAPAGEDAAAQKLSGGVAR